MLIKMLGIEHLLNTEFHSWAFLALISGFYARVSLEENQGC